MSGQVEFTGAAVRDETGSALPARYSTRENAAVPPSPRPRRTSWRGKLLDAAVCAADLTPCLKSSGGAGFESTQRPRRFFRASDSAAA